MNKIVVQEKNLTATIKRVSKALKKKNILPVLDNYLFQVRPEGCYVTATDLEAYLTGILNVSVANDSSFDFLLPVESVKMLAKLKGNIFSIEAIKELDEKNPRPEEPRYIHSIRIYGENKVIDYPTEDPEEYPSVPEFESLGETFLSGDDFGKQLKTLIPFVANNELRPIHNGVWFCKQNGKAELVATDSNILGYIPLNFELNHNVGILNPKLLLSLLDKYEFGFEWGEKYHRFIFGDMVYVSRSIEGEFVDYRSVIPTRYNGTFSVSRADMINELETVGFINKNMCILSVGNGKIDITAQCSFEKKKTIKSIVYSETEGDQITFGMDTSIFFSFLNAIPEESLTFEYTEPDRPFLVNTYSSVFLIMPKMIGG